MPSKGKEKKKQTKEETTKKSKKEKLTFEERFKDKKNVVGKAGLIQILDMHEPFNLDAPQREHENNKGHLISTHSPSSSKNAHLAPRGNRTELGREKQVMKSVTPPYKQRKRNQSPSLSVKLPKITSSTPNLHNASQKNQSHIINSQKGNYWGQLSKLTKNKTLGKRASQLGCVNLVRMNYDANSHYDVMTKFNRIFLLKKNLEKKNNNFVNSVKKVKKDDCQSKRSEKINPESILGEPTNKQQRRMSVPSW